MALLTKMMNARGCDNSRQAIFVVMSGIKQSNDLNSWARVYVEKTI